MQLSLQLFTVFPFEKKIDLTFEGSSIILVYTYQLIGLSSTEPASTSATSMLLRQSYI